MYAAMHGTKRLSISSFLTHTARYLQTSRVLIDHALLKSVLAFAECCVAFSKTASCASPPAALDQAPACVAIQDAVSQLANESELSSLQCLPVFSGKHFVTVRKKLCYNTVTGPGAYCQIHD